MGAWGSGSFENDLSLDWLNDLEKSDNINIIVNTLKNVIDNDLYIDADEGNPALAAAELIAALGGNQADDLPDIVKNWVSNQKFIDTEKLVSLAIDATEKIRNSEISELKQLWGESGENDTEWHQGVDQLLARLKVISGQT